MLTNTRGGFQRFTIGLLIAAAICLAGGLLMVTQAQAGGRATPPAGSALHVSVAPLNPAFLRSLVAPPIGAPSSAAVDQPLGDIPSPQDFSYTRGMQMPGARAGAAVDLRPAHARQNDHSGHIGEGPGHLRHLLGVRLLGVA